MTKINTAQFFHPSNVSQHQLICGDKHDVTLDQNVMDSLMTDTSEIQKFKNFLAKAAQNQIEIDPHNIGLTTHRSNDGPAPNLATTLTNQVSACFSGCPLC